MGYFRAGARALCFVCTAWMVAFIIKGNGFDWVLAMLVGMGASAGWGDE